LAAPEGGASVANRQECAAVRRAVVDIGTNSTRLLVADVEDGRVGEALERRTEITRLGAGVDADGRLSGEAMQRVYKVLDEYRKLIDAQGADDAVAVLTSAVRDAANGEEFATAVRERWGLEPHVLTGDEEARLTFLGATSERDPDDRTPTLVIDIGGGSTEFVIGTGREMSFHVSNQAGVVRQTERHLHSDPPTADEQAALAHDVREILSAGVPESERRAVSHAIAVAGTATSLASIAQELEPYDPDKVEGFVLSAEECRRILERLAGLTLAERRQVRGLHPDRAPTIVAGAIILLETLDLVGLDEVEVSEHDILRGAALGLE
jgi:exopolyphosphatase / guanosine-5'-triphosphate,3'-diphosphate pyrophosphatase